MGAVVLASSFLLGNGIAFAQTSATPTTPGVPSTGTGGNSAANVLILGASALAALAGGLYLTRKLAPR